MDFKSILGGRPERFACLTEEQATISMTDSRNTQILRGYQPELVKALKILLSKPWV
ncbi:MAG: hypothetical protein QNJ54_27245 [Prochloraceae cyanobacterium]|nr:hypothetical protein [Prochloraceae cyanobacterium]